MTRALAATSIFIARETGRPLAEQLLPDELAVSVITVGELRAACSQLPMCGHTIAGWRR